MALPQEQASSLLKACKNLKQSESIKHVFTHRRLWMHIWGADLTKPFELSDPDFKWVALNQLGHYGLPQPIKVLLQKLSLTRGDDLKN